MYLYVFYFLILINIAPISLFSFFSAFNDISDDIILITDEGVLNYDPFSNNITKIYKNILFDNIRVESSRLFISFVKFPPDSISNYTIIGFQENLFFLKNKKYVYDNSFFDRDFSNVYKLIIPYKRNEDNLQLIYVIIKNGDLFLAYDNITLSDTINQNVIFQTTINYQNITGDSSTFSNDVISCQLMPFKNIINEKLICFIGLEPYQLLTLVFDIENNFTIIDSLIHNETNKNIKMVNSILKEDKKICFICYIYNSYDTECMIYNSEENKFGEVIKLNDSCLYFNYFNNFFYLSKYQKYMFYCFLGRYQLKIFIFDNNFNLKKINFNYYDSPATFFYYRNNSMYTSDFLFLPNYYKVFYIYTTSLNTFEYFELNETFLFSNCIIIDNNTNMTSDSDLINNNISNNDTFNNKNMIDIITIFNDKDINGKVRENINLSLNDKNILIGKTSQVKEIINDNIKDIINQIKIDKKYIINGQDYDICISPINSYKELNCSYIDLGECKDILRKNYNLPSDEIISIFGMEINPLNEKVLGNQIEYTLFDEENNILDLSLCNDIPIIIDYKIINSSIINETMVLYYSNLNIDIYNINDQFFQNICYPYSIGDTDIILRDRISDIYQNYSLCEDNCEYTKLDIESMTVKCECKVKNEIKTEIKPPIFHQIILNAFKDSNFGVILCYKLVFNLSNIFKNVGFLISLIIFVLHIPLYILYFIYKIKSVKYFVFEEMKKNNYIKQINDSYINSEKKETIESIEHEKDKNINKKKYKDEIKIKSRKNVKHSPTRIIDNNNNNIYYEQKKNDNTLKIDKNDITIGPISKEGEKLNTGKAKKDINESNLCQSFSLLKKTNNNKPKLYKKVKFVDSKMSDKNNLNYAKKIFGKNNNIIRVRRTISHKSPSLIFKKILGNEETANFPGFYNLIHVNVKNSSENRPLDSKYILDNYNYENAIKYDKRPFLRIYFICLLSKVNFLNTFFFKSPLELQTIKLCIFLFTHSCDFALNAFFYLNQNISDRYHYKGINLFYYSLINNLTISIASTLISFLLVKFLSLLSNSKDDIVYIFREGEEKMRNDKNFKFNAMIKSNIIIRLKSIFRKLKKKNHFFYYFRNFNFIIFLLLYDCILRSISGNTDKLVSRLWNVNITYYSC